MSSSSGTGETFGRFRRNPHRLSTSPPSPKRFQRCIIAGSRPGDLVLDPFAGTGTTGLCAFPDRSAVRRH